ncbi:MAG: hypothetical protein U0414_32200 [Polyangiaceae bacterium]
MAALNLLGRALQLLLLTLAPTVGAPEPGTPGALIGVIALVYLLAAPAVSALLYRNLRTLESLAAAIGWAVTSVVLVVVASVFRGESAPLLRGYYLAAPFVWISLALTAASLGGRYLGTTIRGRKAFSAIVVLVVGVIVFRVSADHIAAAREPKRPPGAEGTPAIEKQPDPRTIDRVGELLPALDQCVARDPKSCTCLARRAMVRARLQDSPGATADVLAAEGAGCAADEAPIRLREIAVSVFALANDLVAVGARLEAAKDRASNPVFLYGDGLLALARGDADDALRLAKAAVDAGGDRDAQLFYVQLLIGKRDDATARPLLQKLLAQFPSDGNALYDLALLDDYAGDYNRAREGYLAALKVDPKQRNARYNLAMLTLGRGISGEAKHHAEAFAKDYPDDPRGPTLLKITGSR